MEWQPHGQCEKIQQARSEGCKSKNGRVPPHQCTEEERKENTVEEGQKNTSKTDEAAAF